MQFQSFVFLQFFVGFYLLYWLLRRQYRLQNVLLLIASYIFYGYWDWRFLGLLCFSTIADYTIARLIDQSSNFKRRRFLLLTSLTVNLAILGFFKYFNFFQANLVRILDLFGMGVDGVTLNIILPVGLSFYTFQGLSYVFDVYKDRMKPAKSLLEYATFVAFFPQLVAGPIERADHMLPQIAARRLIKPEQIDTGLFLILFGYFKKVVVADNLAQIANPIFNNYTQYQGLDILVGILAFTGQIYSDFSAYSDIARGLAKLMGFELMVNFRLPYFAINPSDFWARWHISLSTWLRDYLYIPLGGNRHGNLNTYRNLAITMLLGGLWHGAAWNFVLWGAFHGAILIVYRIYDRRQPEPLQPEHRILSYCGVGLQMLIMFVLINLSWLIFRSHSFAQFYYMLTHWSVDLSQSETTILSQLIFFSLPLVIVEILQALTGDLLILTKLVAWIRVPIYSFFLLWIVIYGVRTSSEFIYFQF
mgnify:CR=1 FL=1